MAVKMLNIGCGAHYHPDWINLDVAPADPKVIPVDINHGLPFPSDSARICYSSHVLEHLDKDGARRLITECFRVLEPGGAVRFVLPDLEALAREYLHVLDAVASGQSSRALDYDWLMLELYDQTVRTSSGGEMALFLKRLPETDRAFVRSRIGVEAEQFWLPNVHSTLRPKNRVSFLKLSKFGREKLAYCLVYLIAGRSAAQSFRMGLFRNSGEIHQWMYDRYSLGRLLHQAGFVDVKVSEADESRIPEYLHYSLDTLNGVARKPDSLYIEAFKP